jgi:gamma-glutamyltranspeptidase/glutathione hydrolase
VQAAIEAPRWVHGAPGDKFGRDEVVLEARFEPGVADELRASGHQVVVTDVLDDAMGTVQAIELDSVRGCYSGGSDPRGDGCALAA